MQTNVNLADTCHYQPVSLRILTNKNGKRHRLPHYMNNTSYNYSTLSYMVDTLNCFASVKEVFLLRQAS